MLNIIYCRWNTDPHSSLTPSAPAGSELKVFLQLQVRTRLSRQTHSHTRTHKHQLSHLTVITRTDVIIPVKRWRGAGENWRSTNVENGTKTARKQTWNPETCWMKLNFGSFWVCMQTSGKIFGLLDSIQHAHRTSTPTIPPNAFYRKLEMQQRGAKCEELVWAGSVIVNKDDVILFELYFIKSWRMKWDYNYQEAGGLILDRFLDDFQCHDILKWTESCCWGFLLKGYFTQTTNTKKYFQ